MRCERTGINPKWPTQESVVSRIKKGFSTSDFDFMFDVIREYVTREDSNTTKEFSNTSNVTNGKAEELGRLKVDVTLALAPHHPAWLKELPHWARYYELGLKMNFFWHYRFRLFPNRVRDLKMLNIEYAAQMMGVMAVLGWRAATEYQGYITHAALNRGYQLELQYYEEHRRAQAFMLRLFSDWVGDVEHAWPKYAYDESIYQNLLTDWRNPDPDALIPCLLAACDRHTYEAHRDSSKKFYDFHNLGLMRTPIEILFLFRLREWEGLENPTLDHPLMAAPFDQLPEPQPMPELDELMQNVLKRAREDWSSFDEVVSLDELKKQV
jgi:hypothetical protein